MWSDIMMVDIIWRALICIIFLGVAWSAICLLNKMHGGKK